MLSEHCSESDQPAPSKDRGIFDEEADSILRDFCRVAAHLCGAKRATIHLLNAGRQCCAAQIGKVPKTAQQNEFLVERAFESGDILFQEQVQDQFYIGMPLFVEGNIMGVLSVFAPAKINVETGKILVSHARGLACLISTKSTKPSETR